MGRAGLPPTMQSSGTSFVTPALAAIMQRLPIAMPGQITALPPIRQWSPIVTGSPCSAFFDGSRLVVSPLGGKGGIQGVCFTQCGDYLRQTQRLDKLGDAGLGEGYQGVRKRYKMVGDSSQRTSEAIQGGRRRGGMGFGSDASPWALPVFSRPGQNEHFPLLFINIPL